MLPNTTESTTDAKSKSRHLEWQKPIAGNWCYGVEMTVKRENSVEIARDARKKRQL